MVCMKEQAMVQNTLSIDYTARTIMQLGNK